MTNWQQIFRIDSILLTTIGGAVTGCLVQCGDCHTIAHGPARAFLVASLTAAVAAFIGGCLGRMFGGAVCSVDVRDAWSRWIGNVVAFVSAAVIVPVFALA
jgi:hypothetical protein